VPQCTWGKVTVIDRWFDKLEREFLVALILIVFATALLVFGVLLALTEG